jgi:N-acetylmuramoyl-L-alanine amidase
VVETPYDQLTDEQLFTLAVWREADSQGFDGMRAVAHSIWNRVNSGITWWGTGLRSILLRNSGTNHVYQYDCFDPKDPDSLRWPDDANPQWVQAGRICASIEIDPDNTGGGTTYYSTTIPAPWWAADMRQTAKIGDLIFFQ